MSRTIEISDETYLKIKDQLGEEDLELESWEDFIGRKWFVRTVTYHTVGRLVKRIPGVGGNGDLLQFEQASWVADSGRFMDAIKKGTLSEVEPTGTCFVHAAAIVDIFPWNHPLPTEQK